MLEGARYRFEPLERGGLVLGLSAAQVAVLASAALVALGLLSGGHGADGAVGALGVIGLGALLCRPVAGKPLMSWLALGARFLARPRSAAQAPPGLALARPQFAMAKLLAPGLKLVELEARLGPSALGVLLDERYGTAAALLRARGAAFCLLDEQGKQQRLASWASVLESLTSQSGSLARLQWCQRNLPGDNGPLLRRLEEAGDPGSPSYQDHVGLVEAAKSWRHETLLVVAVRWHGSLGKRGQNGLEVLLNEVTSLRSQLRGAGFACEPALDAAGIAAAVGAFLGPVRRCHPGAYQWPLVTDEHWSALRVDGLWHRTYWVAEWPRSHVGPDFLSPLLLSEGSRAFSVVMAPVPPERAAREAESSRVAQLADSQLRSQGGFLETARQRRKAEALESREALLADGRGAFELAGYVTISASDEAGLDKAGAQLERAASAARLCLRCLYGQQKEALAWAMPFGRGV
ncbi:MAG: SCO6880 family protein [Acidimicrobiales bacterium]